MRPADLASRTLRLDVAYEGTRYSGFGIQPGRLTVQEVLEEALARSLGEQVRVTAAGRTDAGVHASGQVVKKPKKPKKPKGDAPVVAVDVRFRR